MEQQYTLSILKPDVLERNITGKINTKIESSGLKIVAQKMKILTKSETELFYSEHKNLKVHSNLRKRVYKNERAWEFYELK